MPFKKLIPFSSLFLFNYIIFLRKQCTLIFLIDNEKRYVWFISAAAAAKSLQSCPTLCDPRDGSAPGSPIPGILQARTLEWVAISFSNAWKWKVKVKSLSRARLLVTPWTAAHQAPPSMGFSRQEYWSAVPLPSPSSLAELSQITNYCLLINEFLPSSQCDMEPGSYEAMKTAVLGDSTHNIRRWILS